MPKVRGGVAGATLDTVDEDKEDEVFNLLRGRVRVCNDSTVSSPAHTPSARAAPLVPG